MKILLTILCLAALLLLFACNSKSNQVISASSPSGKIKVSFFLSEKGQPAYQVRLDESVVIDTSHLGFTFTDQPALTENLAIESQEVKEYNETWKPVWGPDSKVVNHYNELRVNLKEKSQPGRHFAVEFRVFDDGIGFRYDFPPQEGWNEALVLDELTEFQLTGDHECWWQPADWEIYEHLYTHSRLSEVDTAIATIHPGLAQTHIPDRYAVNTPFTLKTADTVYMSFHEAALYDFTSTTLHVDREKFKLSTALVGGPNPYKAKRALPFHTPWRTITICRKAGYLIESHLIENLNEPCKIENTSWIKPTKYMGIWWEMHIGKGSWDLAGINHAATTANAKRYIDFASKNAFPALLIEGWNTGWEHFWAEKREGVFDFVTPYADFDIAEVVRYGKEKGVKLIGHHETASAVLTYEKQLDTAFTFYRNLGIDAVKTGYVGKLSPVGEYHHGQWMVNHYQKVVETAARYGIMIDAHEPIKDTGIRRTWPNFMARETMRGQEFNAWGNPPNPPDHVCNLPFTMGLAGPLDYTPGAVNLLIKGYDRQRISHTMAKELALYVTVYSPLVMACDLPEHYTKHPDAFDFIKQAVVEWDESHVLDGEPGDFLTIVRKQKGQDRWYLGSITDEHPRKIQVPCSFLPSGKKFTAQVWADDELTHWDSNPYPMKRRTIENVSSSDMLNFYLAPGGGLAVIFE
jgi:hypothetical protein